MNYETETLHANYETGSLHVNYETGTLHVNYETGALHVNYETGAVHVSSCDTRPSSMCAYRLMMKLTSNIIQSKTCSGLEI